MFYTTQTTRTEAKQKSVSLFLEALYRGKISVVDESSFAHSLRLRSKFIKNEFIWTNETEMITEVFTRLSNGDSFGKNLENLTSHKIGNKIEPLNL